MIGIIVSLHASDMWWGGGYYRIVWNKEEWSIKEGQEVSYEEMHRWRLSNIAKVFPAPKNI